MKKGTVVLLSDKYGNYVVKITDICEEYISGYYGITKKPAPLSRHIGSFAFENIEWIRVASMREVEHYIKGVQDVRW